MPAQKLRDDIQARLKELLCAGVSIRAINASLKIGTRTIQRYKKHWATEIADAAASNAKRLDPQMVNRAVIAAAIEVGVEAEAIYNTRYYARSPAFVREPWPVTRARAYAALALRAATNDMEFPPSATTIAVAVGAADPTGYLSSLDARLRIKNGTGWWCDEKFMRIFQHTVGGP